MDTASLISYPTMNFIITIINTHTHPLLLQSYNAIETNVARANVETLNDLAHGMSEKCD